MYMVAPTIQKWKHLSAKFLNARYLNVFVTQMFGIHALTVAWFTCN